MRGNADDRGGRIVAATTGRRHDLRDRVGPCLGCVAADSDGAIVAVSQVNKNGRWLRAHRSSTAGSVGGHVGSARVAKAVARAGKATVAGQKGGRLSQRWRGTSRTGKAIGSVPRIYGPERGVPRGDPPQSRLPVSALEEQAQRPRPPQTRHASQWWASVSPLVVYGTSRVLRRGQHVPTDVAICSPHRGGRRSSALPRV